MSVSPVAKVLMSASAFSVWLCSCWYRRRLLGGFQRMFQVQPFLEPQPVRAVPSMARASVRERIFFILSNLLGDWAFFRLPLAV